MSFTKGVNHVALTVLDLDKTVTFFTETLGYNLVGENKDYPAAFVSDGQTMLALWRVKEPEKVISFDRRNTIGLHHLAITVDNDRLDELHEKLAATPECTIEFAPETMYGGPSRHMMCFIPGSGIRIEFTSPVA